MTRMRAKEIRYALDFFETIFPTHRKVVERLSRVLKDVQDALGTLNDFVAHRQLAGDSALTAPPGNRRARAFVAGIIVGHEDEAASAVMKGAVKSVAKQRFHMEPDSALVTAAEAGREVGAAMRRSDSRVGRTRW